MGRGRGHDGEEIEGTEKGARIERHEEISNDQLEKSENGAR